jgi:hypothetical protein
MENLSIYDQLKNVPDSALKTIGAGRLKGKSDINPQWRYQKLTETFGPCGFGWKFTIEKQWIETTATGEIACFVNVNLFIKVDQVWSDAIPGNGGSMFIANESKGPYVSDECFKMATTDAIGTAAKMIGLASDVYLGLKNSNIPAQTKYDKPESNEPDKPWLNKGQQLDKAMDYLRKGGKIETIESKYKLSKEIRQNLNEVIKGLA